MSSTFPSSLNHCGIPPSFCQLILDTIWFSSTHLDASQNMTTICPIPFESRRVQHARIHFQSFDLQQTSSLSTMTKTSDHHCVLNLVCDSSVSSKYNSRFPPTINVQQRAWLPSECDVMPYCAVTHPTRSLRLPPRHHCRRRHRRCL